MRRWLQQNLPEAEAFTRKRGFTVPVGEWIAGKAARVAPLVARQSGVAEMCKPEAVLGLFNALPARGGNDRMGRAAWVLLFFALWHQIHILNLPPDGDIFDCLDQA